MPNDWHFKANDAAFLTHCFSVEIFIFLKKTIPDNSLKMSFFMASFRFTFVSEKEGHSKDSSMKHSGGQIPPRNCRLLNFRLPRDS
jgi:hypothetical protein